MLRVMATTPIMIEPAAEFEPILSLTSDGITHQWHIDSEGVVFRELRDEKGGSVSADDLEDVHEDRLFGHYRKRKWWRDHPSSFDLGLEPETLLAASVLSGKPGDFFYVGNARRHQEVFVRHDIINGINKNAGLLRHARGRLLIQAPLPGYVVQIDDGRVKLDHWIPSISESRSPAQGHFAHVSYAIAEDLALRLSPGAELPSTKPTILQDIDDQYPDLKWSPMGTTLWSMLFAMAEKLRTYIDLPPDGEEARSSGKAILELAYVERFSEAITACAPFLGYPDALIEAVIEFSPGLIPDDVDWSTVLT